ncbi:transcription factor TFIIIB subunit brf1 [Entophlyctis luteolus]|nr:transcription factor TFIIIB subunit brf1 [Entophlyctis luteolus]
MRSCACGSSEVEYENALGHLVCVACGQVLEQNSIVSEVTFTEGSGGGASADGFFVAKGAARAATSSRGLSGISTSKSGDVSESSREQTIANGHRRISQIGYQMRMTDRQIENAQRYFTLAVTYNFTKGRKANSIASGCLYIVCRTEKTSHMLIDFAEHLRMNLYTLGSVFSGLVQALKINDLPLVDPMLYIVRFANKLEFDDKVEDVIRDATRLVSRMDRDWIVKGRKPAGICGAALFIASRMNGYRRSLKEIAEVVKTCTSTLENRLFEFKQTPSSALSVNEFHDIMLESSHDPPSFYRKRKAVVATVEGGTDNLEIPETVEHDLREIIESDDMKNALKSRKCFTMVSVVDPRPVGGRFDHGTSHGDDLSALDEDTEIQDCLLTEAEIELKTMFWEAENNEWERLKAISAKSESAKVVKKRKKRKPNSSQPLPAASSALEAGMQLLASQPSLSKKINYDMMENLFNDDSGAYDFSDGKRSGDNDFGFDFA